MTSAYREWRQRIENDVSVLRMTSANREWRQRIENDVSVSKMTSAFLDWCFDADLVLTRCQIVLSWWRFGPMVVVLWLSVHQSVCQASMNIIFNKSKLESHKITSSYNHFIITGTHRWPYGFCSLALRRSGNFTPCADQFDRKRRIIEMTISSRNF